MGTKALVLARAVCVAHTLRAGELGLRLFHLFDEGQGLLDHDLAGAGGQVGA